MRACACVCACVRMWVAVRGENKVEGVEVVVVGEAVKGKRERGDEGEVGKCVGGGVCVKWKSTNWKEIQIANQNIFSEKRVF